MHLVRSASVLLGFAVFVSKKQNKLEPKHSHSNLLVHVVFSNNFKLKRDYCFSFEFYFSCGQLFGSCGAL